MTALIQGLDTQNRTRRPDGLDLSKPPPVPYSFPVPTLYRRTAKAFAGAFYEGKQRFVSIKSPASNMAPPDAEAERTNAFRRNWPSQRAYVAWCWPIFVGAAREHLVSLLHPDSNITDFMREEVYKARLSEEAMQAFFTEQQVEPYVRGISGYE